MIRRRRSVGALACVAAVSLLGGCAGGARSFDDLAGLANAVAGQGVPCEGVHREPSTDLVDEIGTCRGSEVTLYLFENAEALADWKKVASLVTPAAVGPNWAVTGERSAVDRIAEGLGAGTALASHD